ncbi:MAG: methyltransferase, TIGR04325 family [Hyphomicrobiaceae bacterium]
MLTITSEQKRAIKSLVRRGNTYYRRMADAGAMVRGRLLNVAPISITYRGAYESYAQAISAVPASKLPGYNHEDIAETSFDFMCRLAPWDYPVLYWLNRLLGDNGGHILDAGGHMGTKYRAFSGYIDFGPDVTWTVYDLPEIIKAGRRKAAEDHLDALTFIDAPGEAGHVDILLASGLLQYLDISFTDLIGQLRHKPPSIIINKLAVRDGDMVVTLENFGPALVPYQIRCRDDFFAEIRALGYRVVDEWQNPTLAHVIPTHPELGPSTSLGLVLELA